MEDQIIQSFLEAPLPYLDPIKVGTPVKRGVGLPQGTSISLFLANVAAAPLDRALERLGVGFVRYADDTVIWSPSYNAICEAASVLHELSEAIGSPINVDKSPGIRILQPRGVNNAEMLSTTRVEYLGHEIGLSEVRMRDSAIARIKGRIDELLYTNLLLEPIRGTQDMTRVTTNDRDYVVYIWQLRRYLYGSLSESQVRRFQDGQVPPMTFKGVMSFFPLVNDQDALSELDGWIATRTWLALRKRRRLLSPAVASGAVPVPWGAARADLYQLMATSTKSGANIDLRLPSIQRISKLIQTAINIHGVATVTGRVSPYNYSA